MIRFFIFFFIIFSNIFLCASQEKLKITNKFFAQGWVRFTENNAGTANQYDEPNPTSLNFIIRRLRYIAFADLSKKDLIFSHIGINGITKSNNSANLILHEIWYKRQLLNIENRKLGIGFGLHFWNGLSRISNLSLVQMVTADFPISSVPFNSNRSIVGRQNGFFTQGRFNRLSFRINVNKPLNDNSKFHNHSINNTIGSINSSKISTAGYFYFHFKDKEDQKLAYIPSTYYGERQIFNIGLGYYYHPSSIGLFVDEQLLKKANQISFAADIFYDCSINNKSAISIYGMFQKTNSKIEYYNSTRYLSENTGPYIGYVGVASIGGFGNGQPLVGTGNLTFAQIAYCHYLDKVKGIKLQPYIALTNKNLNLLTKNITNWDLGISFFPKHSIYKLNVQYSLRPEVQELQNRQYEYRNRQEIFFNFHIFI